MKILIQNYNNEFSTEASYLQHSFSQAGLECVMWEEDRLSAFDAFDQFQPDVFISHYMNISPDTIKRLSNDKCKLVLNVSEITENSAGDLEEALKEANVNIEFFFYNYSKPSGFTVDCVQVMSGADVFLGGHSPSMRQIPWAVVSDQPEVPEVPSDVYHKLTLAAEHNDSFDAALTIADLCNTSSVYTNIMLAGNDPKLIIGQPFFDMTIRLSGKCTVKINDENEKLVGEFMQHVFSDFPGTPEAVKDYMVNTVMKKHTCLNRAERVASKLGLEEATQNLRKMQERLGTEKV